MSSQVVSPLISNMIRRQHQFTETRRGGLQWVRGGPRRGKKKKKKGRKKKFHAQTQKKYFDIDPKRKHIKRHFYTCLLQAQKAEMVSGENKTEGLFLPTIALSYKNLLESQASPQCQPPSPPLLPRSLPPLPPPLFASLSPFSSLSPLRGRTGPSLRPDRLRADA